MHMVAQQKSNYVVLMESTEHSKLSCVLTLYFHMMSEFLSASAWSSL